MIDLHILITVDLHQSFLWLHPIQHDYMPLHIVKVIGGIKHGKFSCLDYLEEKSLVNGLIMVNGY